jgi:hypothetical protein
LQSIRRHIRSGGLVMCESAVGSLQPEAFINCLIKQTINERCYFIIQ